MNVRPLRACALALLLLTVVLAACANKEESARHDLAQIKTAVTTAGLQALKYCPDELAAVNKQVADLDAKFSDKQYAAVIDAAPAVLQQAKALQTTAAARHAEDLKKMEGEWPGLETSVPAAIAAAEQQARAIVAAGKAPAGAGPQAMTVAKQGFAGYDAFWKQALEAKAAGDTEKAVQIARSIEKRIGMLTQEMGGTTP
jgi:hypothetical protein